MNAHMKNSRGIAELAEAIARRAHAGQFRRDGVTPYITHPERVASKLTGQPEAEAVAWLHDVLEDTAVTAQDLLDGGVPRHVVAAVKCLTKQPGQAYEDYLAEIRNTPLARQVKVQDMLDNLADSPTDAQILKYARGLLLVLGHSSGG